MGKSFSTYLITFLVIICFFGLIVAVYAPQFLQSIFLSNLQDPFRFVLFSDLFDLDQLRLMLIRVHRFNIYDLSFMNSFIVILIDFKHLIL